MIKNALKAGGSLIGSAGDVNTVRKTGGGEGLKQVYGITEGVSSAASLGKDISGFIPGSQKALSGLSSASNLAGGIGKFAGAAARASPILGAGGMVIEAVDVIRNPEASMKEVEGISDKGALERAAYGFSNPVKTITATGRNLAELATLTYDNWKTNRELDKKYKEQNARSSKIAESYSRI